MRLSRIAAAALFGIGSSVTFAADLGTPSGIVGAPSYGPPPSMWSGLYLGVHGGYGSANASGTSFDGVLGGLQLGYNAQVGNMILGIEADASSADIGRTDTASLFGLAASASTHTYALGTGRARLGFAVNQFMIYGTGGFAWAANEIKGTIGGVSISDSKVHTGYTFGAGVEWMIVPAWTARAEYLYANFGSQSYFGGAVSTGRVDTNIVRVGVNYLFR